MKDTEARIETLYDAIKHGDDEHKAWLKQAIDAHFSGQPVPAPRGQGNKEAQIEALQARNAMLWNIFISSRRAYHECQARHGEIPLAQVEILTEMGAQQARAALSTPAEPVKPRVKVKPLIWEPPVDGVQYATTNYGKWYVYRSPNGEWGWNRALMEKLRFANSEDEAKANCEREHESLVLSNIEDAG